MKNSKYLLLSKCVNDTYINNKKVSWNEFNNILFDDGYEQVGFYSYIDKQRGQLVKNWQLKKRLNKF